MTHADESMMTEAPVERTKERSRRLFMERERLVGQFGSAAQALVRRGSDTREELHDELDFVLDELEPEAGDD